MSKSEILDGKTLFVHMFPTSNVLNSQFSCLNDVFCKYFHDVVRHYLRFKWRAVLDTAMERRRKSLEAGQIWQFC